MGGLLRIVFSIIPCRAVLCKKGGQLAFAVAGVYNETDFGPVRAKEEGKMDLMNLALIVPVSLCGSYIQNVTGFGYGIFVMIFFPLLLQYTEANILSTMLGGFSSLAIVLQMRHKIHWKSLIFPLIGSVVATYLAVNFIKGKGNDTLTLLLGVVLFVLSMYFFFFSGKVRFRPTWYAGLLAGVLSGVMSGMFSMGGPPMVIYFLQSEDDSDTYLATISAYFVCSTIVSVTYKVMAGFLTVNACYAFVTGAIGLAGGVLLGKRTRSKVRPDMVRKLVYGFMALSGLLYIVTALA